MNSRRFTADKYDNFLYICGFNIFSFNNTDMFLVVD